MNYRISRPLFDPIRVAATGPTVHDCSEIVRLYNNAGFAILELPRFCSPTMIRSVLARLDLTTPYVPKQYLQRPDVYSRGGYNVVSAGGAQGVHRAFETALGQDLHCDGTLESIGAIATSVLYCESAAWSGGETTIFHAADAYRQLLEKYREAACLLKPSVLTRTDVGYSEESYRGPAFSINNSVVTARFAIDNTSKWSDDEWRVIAFRDELRELASGMSSFGWSFKLQPGQVLIMANDRVAHARAAYVDSSKTPRRLYRFLFTNRPRFLLLAGRGLDGRERDRR